MERYRNLGGNSGVYAYEIGNAYIKVQFSDLSVYTYSYYGKAGKNHVDNMKQLAIQGEGLNSYINTKVKYLYD